MSKRHIIIPVLLLMAVSLFAQAEAEEPAAKEKTVVTVAVPATSPPSLGMLKIMEEQPFEDYEIKLEVWNQPEQLIAMVQDENHHMFGWPLTVVAKLYNRGIDVRLMNVNTWGVTYFITTDPDFKGWEDLKGKTLYCPSLASPPAALTHYFLKEVGLVPGEDVDLVYLATGEVAQVMMAGKGEYAVLLEPQVTNARSKNPDIRVAFSFESEWQRITGTDTMVPNAGFGTKASFIDANPEFVAEFQDKYEEAISWALENPAEAAVLGEKYLGVNRAVYESAIPRMGLCFKSGVDAWDELKVFYELLNNDDKTIIGGRLPDDGMLYKR